jgi:hypothetical protein
MSIPQFPLPLLFPSKPTTHPATHPTPTQPTQPTQPTPPVTSKLDSDSFLNEDNLYSPFYKRKVSVWQEKGATISEKNACKEYPPHCYFLSLQFNFSPISLSNSSPNFSLQFSNFSPIFSNFSPICSNFSYFLISLISPFLISFSHLSLLFPLVSFFTCLSFSLLSLLFPLVSPFPSCLSFSLLSPFPSYLLFPLISFPLISFFLLSLYYTKMEMTITRFGLTPDDFGGLSCQMRLCHGNAYNVY